MDTAAGVAFLDPRADPATPVTPYTLSFDVFDGPITIGLLANGFPDSVVFLDRLGATLAAQVPELELRAYDKGNPTTTASEGLLDSIVAECHAVVGAYGH